jgi:peptidoglycan/LPS O-acetylase OafA/YrhL
LSKTQQHKFVALDALRGVAAFAVMDFHFYGMFGGQIFPRGYLAVDFFFVLSGFVLNLAYQKKLDAGWPTLDFLRLRVIRLYPLYIVGLVLGIFYALHEARYNQSHGHFPFATVLFFAILLLPLPQSVHLSEPYAFPLNLPSWSLFCELLANVFHALLLRRRSTVFLAGTAAISGIALACMVYFVGDLNVGGMRGEVLYAVPRVIFPYTLGILLFRIWKARPMPALHPAFAAALLLLPMMIPKAVGHRGLWWSDLPITFLLWPAIVLCSAAYQPSKRFAVLYQALGIASYGVYVIHVPMGYLFTGLWLHLRHRSPNSDAPWSGLLFLLLVFGVTLLADRYYDIPVRNWLRRKTGDRRSESATIPG